MSLLVRLISSLTPAMSEPAILHHSFDLLCAFDEVVSLGYKENVSLSQVRNVLEGESHEEKIQEIIARNKEAEAKEELKRRAKQLEIQRREQQRRAQQGGGGSSGGYGGGGGGGGGMAGGYTAAPRYDAPAAPEYRTSSPAPAASAPKPAFKGAGMKLGGKKAKQGELAGLLGGEVDEPEPEPYYAAAPAAAEPEPEPVAVSADVLEKVDQERSVPAYIHLQDSSWSEIENHADMMRSVHVAIKEQLSVTLLRDGGVRDFELKGDLNLQVSDASLSKLKLSLADKSYSDLQFKQHPNVAKFASSGEKVIALKDTSRSFPVGQGLGVLRWRMTSKDESNVPLSSTSCPSFSFEDLRRDADASPQSRAGRNPAETARRTLPSSTSSRRSTSPCATSSFPSPSRESLIRSFFPAMRPVINL